MYLKAFKLYRQAAGAGSSSAAFWVARAYDGMWPMFGQKKDMAESWAWASVAVDLAKNSRERTQAQGAKKFATDDPMFNVNGRRVRNDAEKAAFAEQAKRRYAQIKSSIDEAMKKEAAEKPAQ